MNAYQEAPAPPHDPLLCGIDPCTDCEACRPRTLHLRRLEALQERLQAGGISVSDLADLLWYQFADSIEQIVERVAREEIRRALCGVKLVAQVTDSYRGK